jgi:predicted dehydrogenase
MDLRVGMIGVNADRGWAREAHAPAVIATEGMTLAAIATRRQESADAAAGLFGVLKAYGDASALIHDADIDVVAVVSAVPTHHDLILEALAAGKHVLTEWPVTIGATTTAKLADAAAAAGERTAIDLQARHDPAAMAARKMIVDGAIGRVRTVRVYSSTAGFGPVTDTSGIPLEDPATGMHLTTIQAAHTLDLLEHVAGARIATVGAVRSVQFPIVRVDASDRTINRVLPDQVLTHGTLDSGAVFTAEIVGGRPADDTPYRMELEGDAGTIRLDGGAARGFQSGVLTLSLDGVEQDTRTPDLPDSVVNVAGVYAALRDDILHGAGAAPTFADAARLAALVALVERADEEGRRLTR